MWTFSELNNVEKSSGSQELVKALGPQALNHKNGLELLRQLCDSIKIYFSGFLYKVYAPLTLNKSKPANLQQTCTFQLNNSLQTTNASNSKQHGQIILKHTFKM